MSQSIGASAPAPIFPDQSRLWKLGVGLLVMLATAIGTARIIGPKTDLIGMPGSDFIPSYMAGAFVRTGHADWLMDAARGLAYQRQLRVDANLHITKNTGPWLNPPFYAWVFVPFATLPFRTALAAWFGLNLLLTVGAVALLATLLPRGRGWRAWGLIPLLLVCSFPYLQVVSSEQNGCISLFLLSATVVCWRGGRRFWAGAIGGLLLFKPQLAAVLIAVMCLGLGWRAICGVATTALGLIATTCITMPGAIHAYFAKLGTVIPWSSAGGTYLWERQITWLGFWRYLFQQHATGPAPLAVTALWLICAVATAGVLAFTVVRAKRMGLATSDRVIAATVMAMPLLMPYFMDYDLMLLAVPAVLLAAEACRTERLDGIGKLLRGGWMALYPWLFVNAALADAVHVNLLVPALATMAVVHCVRALRVETVDVGRASADSPMIANYRASLPMAGERAA